MSRRILLVDDDPAVLRGLSGLLRDEGYRTETAATAAEAHEALSKRDPPAAMVLDLGLSDMSGFELLEYCQQMAERFGFYERCLFHTTVERTEWDESSRRWIVHTNRGDAMRARIVSAGVSGGQISE